MWRGDFRCCGPSGETHTPWESADFSMSAPEDTQERDMSLLNDGSQAELTHRLKESHPA